MVEPADEVSEDEKTLYRFYERLCAVVSESEQGIIVAIERGYDVSPAPATEVFLKVDSTAARSPDATFFNEELNDLLKDAPLQTVGVCDTTNEVDAEARAFRLGHARDRVMAYNLLKSSSLNPNAEDSMVSFVSSTLRETEEAITKAKVEDTPAPPAVIDLLTVRRSYFVDEKLNHPTMSRLIGLGLTTQQIEAMCASGKSDFHDEDTRAIDERVGTERFIALVFAPRDHDVLNAAGAPHSGIRTTGETAAYPAYVTVHNSKGAIGRFPSTVTDENPNSLVVSDAAVLLMQAHSLAQQSGRNPLVLVHEL